MKKSIPLKEIVGFLPYGLKLIAWHKEKEQRTVRMVAIDSEENFYYKDNEPTFYVSAIDEEHNMRGNYGILEIKPIVRPLPDLTKEITHNGETFVPALELVKLKEKYGKWKDIAPSIPYEYKIIKKPFGNILKVTKLDSWVIMISLSEIERSEYFIVEKLKEWHFDIYDWIKYGLAVDINDL